MNTSWKNEWREATLPVNLLKDDRYTILPTKDGPVIQCDTCSQRITDANDRLCDLFDGVLSHEELMHGAAK